MSQKKTRKASLSADILCTPSTSYHHEGIEVYHTDQTSKKAEKCGTAKPKNCFSTLIVTEYLKAGQWFYPKQSNENLTPMNPHLFVLTRSQNNLLICDKYLSARYIAKHAAGVQGRKARVSTSTGKTDKHLEINVGAIENNKIASVKYRLEKKLFRKKEAYYVSLDN